MHLDINYWWRREDSPPTAGNAKANDVRRMQNGGWKAWLGWRWLAGGWLFSCLTLPVQALDPARDLTQYNCLTWGRQNGLMVNQINALAQTRDGYLWLGTVAGLFRFDGAVFTPVPAPVAGAHKVTCLASDPAGGMWTGWDLEQWRFFGNPAAGLPKRQLPPDQNNLHYRFGELDARGELWVVADHQMGHWTAAGGYTNLVDFTDLEGVCGWHDSQGRFWLGTVYRGLWYWENGRFNPFAAPELNGLIIQAITEDPAGNLWVGTASGLFAYDARRHRLPLALPNSEIRALLVDHQGGLWIATTGLGVGRFYRGKLDFFRRADGLSNDNVTALAEDQEGSLWVGTRNGLNQLADVKFPTYFPVAGGAAQDAISVSPAHAGGVWGGHHRRVELHGYQRPGPDVRGGGWFCRLECGPGFGNARRAGLLRDRH